ncbi:MAG TPA: PhzF family phenazine biosynthesis isomerase, partial [Edaphobacter sp.]|nr:PhzF family phenazine biosynthesis isomerase [Edaphobacter sp.]
MSTDDPNNAPATLAAAPATAHCAYDFAQVDVFAENPLEGNALAIFTDARGLTTEEMQALARETNLSETTFIFPCPPDIEHERGVQVRIFLTTEEVPFAGHPTLGTASWLYWNHPVLRGAEQITLDLGVGPIPVRFTPSQPGEQGVFGTMKQNDPTFGEIRNSRQDRDALAAALNLSADDLDPDLPAQVVSTGM